MTTLEAALSQRRDEPIFVSPANDERLGDCVFVLGKFRIYFLSSTAFDLICDVHVFDIKVFGFVFWSILFVVVVVVVV